MKTAQNLHKYFLFAICNFILFVSSLLAQVKLVTPQRSQPEAAEDNTLWYIALAILAAGLIGTVIWYFKDKKSKKEQASEAAKNRKNKSLEDNSVDFDSELEWFRKNKGIVDKNSKRNPKAKNNPLRVSAKSTIINVKDDDLQLDENLEEVFTKKLEKLQFSQLPISRFDRIELPRPYSQLAISNDDALMSAIEQTQDEFEEDEMIRDLAVRILARFKTKNSVEALSQVALYDLSSALRSKAVGVLSDFDHESVFETLLLACADPTREIRAAAARGLFRLSFDRADCWMRLAESDDEFKMRHSARAAIAGGLVERSFDRLIHDDRKIAYEVMALIILLIRAGETEEVFDALENHKNINVRKGILHIIKTSKEHNALDGLYSLLERGKLDEEMREEIDKLVEEIGLVPA